MSANKVELVHLVVNKTLRRTFVSMIWSLVCGNNSHSIQLIIFCLFCKNSFGEKQLELIREIPR